MKRDVQGQTELRVKVAELRGELEPPTTKPTIAELEAILNSGENLAITLLPNGEVRALRDYPNDLNACAELEATLTDEQYAMFRKHLCDFHGNGFRVYSATAEQRCRAFVATMEGSPVPEGNENHL